MIDYATILRNIGYNLTDRGSYWQTSALYRDGDNKTAIRIYKDSGVWCDFVEGNQNLPFEVLIKKTLKTNDVESLLRSNQFNFLVDKKELLKEEKTFPESALKKLLPHYDYFEGRGISEKTLKAYKGGLATGGKLYQRFVFPVYRADEKIHGFSGRKVLDKNDSPKWLHYGKSMTWFYPYYSVDGVKEQCEEEGRIFMVESIGDSMSLFQAGIKNNGVTFTNKIGNKLIARLASSGYDVILSLNNDSGQNRGFDGALTSVLKLIDVVDLEKIWFLPPPKEDFGEMKTEEIKEWRAGITFDTKTHQDSCQKLIDYAPKAKIAKTLRPKIRKFKKKYKFLYEDKE